MPYTTMTYKVPSGQWSWSVLDGAQTAVAGGAGYASEAAAAAAADVELSAHLGSGDASMGMAWWNSLDVTQRRRWLDVAGTAVVADAWEAWKRSQAEL